MRANASGMEMVHALGHDHVLRRNVRVGMKKHSDGNFIVLTFGSHHTGLVNRIGRLKNSLLTASKGRGLRLQSVTVQAEIISAKSKEEFSLVRSQHAINISLGGLLEIKDEDEAGESLSIFAKAEMENLLTDVDIDPALLLLPETGHHHCSLPNSMVPNSGHADYLASETVSEGPSFKIAERSNMHSESNAFRQAEGSASCSITTIVSDPLYSNMHIDLPI